MSKFDAFTFGVVTGLAARAFGMSQNNPLFAELGRMLMPIAEDDLRKLLDADQQDTYTKAVQFIAANFSFDPKAYTGDKLDQTSAVEALFHFNDVIFEAGMNYSPDIEAQMQGWFDGQFGEMGWMEEYGRVAVSHGHPPVADVASSAVN